MRRRGPNHELGPVTGDPGEVTQLLNRLGGGDAEPRGTSPERVVDRLFPLVYDELKGLAQARLRSERPDHTLNATALVHEAYLKLVDQTRANWQNRAHFFAIAARAMRRILVDYAKARNAEKRGGGAPLATFDEESGPRTSGPEELLELDEALTRLEALEPRQARVVEYRFFVGLRDKEIAEALGVSVPTVRLDWRTARAWLGTELGPAP